MAAPDGVYRVALTTPVEGIGVLLAAVSRRPLLSTSVHGTLALRRVRRSVSVMMLAWAPVS